MLEALFFYDGKLSDITTTGMETEDLIDAADGYTNNMIRLHEILSDNKVHRVVSNQFGFLDSAMLWDCETHRSKLYLKDKHDGAWKPVGRFTKKQIKSATNIFRMYQNGEFNDRAYKRSAKLSRNVMRFKID